MHVQNTVFLKVFHSKEVHYSIPDVPGKFQVQTEWDNAIDLEQCNGPGAMQLTWSNAMKRDQKTKSVPGKFQVRRGKILG